MENIKIKVKVVTDHSLTYENIRKEIEKAFQEFQRQFQIGYEIIEIRKWNPTRFPTFILDLFSFFRKKLFGILINLLMKELRKVKREKREIVIGFSGKLKSRYKDTFGADTKGYILIGISKIPISYIILHELGHEFGAKDKNGTGTRSVMNGEETKTCYFFDDENKAIISATLTNWNHH
ncbi:MAG: hypothetical protein V1841_01415 [Patescibacteria group bacterium]